MTLRSRQRNFQRDLLRGVSGISVRGSAPFKVTCCGESQEYPLAPGRFSTKHAAGILSLIRPRKVFQRDMLRSVEGLSARASALSTGSCFGESQEYQSASGRLSTLKCCGESLDKSLASALLPKGHVAWSFRTIPLREIIFSYDMLREASEPFVRSRVPSKGT